MYTSNRQLVCITYACLYFTTVYCIIVCLVLCVACVLYYNYQRSKCVPENENRFVIKFSCLLVLLHVTFFFITYHRKLTTQVSLPVSLVVVVT